MQTIKFAVVGLGNIGKRHIDHILNTPFAELVAVCDINPETQKYLHSKNKQICFFENYNEFLTKKNIDVVNICTPNYLHCDMTVAALQKNMHVVCEKPMAMSVLECEKMITAAQIAQKKLFVVKQNRYNPPVQAVKKMIENGTLGNIYQVVINCFWNRNETYYQQSEWRGKKDKDGGCLFTQFSHFVDIMYYLFGNVTCISGITQNVNHPQSVEFEDSGAFILHTQQQPQAIISFNYSICSYQKNMEGSISILAQNGTVKIGGEYLNTIDQQLIKDYTIQNLPQTAPPNQYGHYQGSMSNHDKVIQNVVSTLNGKSEIATDGENGKQVVDIIENMYKKNVTI